MRQVKRLMTVTLVVTLGLFGFAQCGEPCTKTKDKGTPPGSGRQVCDDKKTLVLR
jgi:hypothetical protein